MGRTESDWIAAVNQASHAKGSIHDEERARELGFAHAVVGAGTHIPFVTKAAVSLFGRSWYERGFLKARFGVPVHAGEEIRIVLTDLDSGPSDERLLEMAIEKRDGTKPLAGFLGLLKNGAPIVAPWERPGERPATSNSMYDPLPLDDVGSVYEPQTMRFEPGESLGSLRVVGDTCTWYESKSPWGGPILPTYRFVKLPRLASDVRAVGDGALDMQSSMNALFQVVHLGPVMCGHPYTVEARLVEKGYSGRTAFRTSEATVRDGERRVAIIRQMLRWVPQQSLQHSA